MSRIPWPRTALLGLLAVALLVAGGIAHLASGEPDGLERVALDLDFHHAERGAPLAVMPDYAIPGLDGALGATLAGLVGALAVLGLLWLTARLLLRRAT